MIFSKILLVVSMRDIGLKLWISNFDFSGFGMGITVGQFAIGWSGLLIPISYCKSVKGFDSPISGRFRTNALGILSGPGHLIVLLRSTVNSS